MYLSAGRARRRRDGYTFVAVLGIALAIGAVVTYFIVH
jgi:hypothetical protein